MIFSDYRGDIYKVVSRIWKGLASQLAPICNNRNYQENVSKVPWEINAWQFYSHVDRIISLKRGDVGPYN